MSFEPHSVALSLVVAGSVVAVGRSIANAVRNVAPGPVPQPTIAAPPVIAPAVSNDTQDGAAAAPPPAAPVQDPQVIPLAAVVPAAQPIHQVVLTTYANALACLRNLADALLFPRLSLVVPVAQVSGFKAMMTVADFSH